MLAAMNGHTTTVKLLLDFGSDINAQVIIKTYVVHTCIHTIVHVHVLVMCAIIYFIDFIILLILFSAPQIETNRNTALTLACFQGRHEVVNLLVERQANVEHRAKVCVFSIWSIMCLLVQFTCMYMYIIFSNSPV